MTLLNIAEAISDETKIKTLGYYLNTPEPYVQRQLVANKMDGKVTSNGTHQILMEWQERTGGEDQDSQLRRALVKSNLRNVADRYLPAGNIYECLE